ncbi:MAG: hypothetical protein LBO62_05545, partial [Endomicrobium sp.]|nr:hypothetical protein [Endomicrobium sp.]
MVSLKDKYYNKRQFKLEKLYADYSSGKISARKYFAVLSKHTDRLGIDLYKYPNTSLYFELLEKEKQIDYKAVSKQLQALVLILKEALSAPAYNMLLDSTAKFSEIEKLYGYLISITRKFKMDLNVNFPQLNEYFKYIELSQKINPLELVSEEQKLNDEINSRFSDTKAQREIVFLIGFQRYVKDFLSGKITADDYDYYLSNIATYKKLYVKYVDNKVLSLLDVYLERVGKFYEINLARNGYFAQSLDLRSNPAGAAGGEAAKRSPSEISENISADKIPQSDNSAAASSEPQYVADVNSSLNISADASPSLIINSMKGKRVDIIITGGFHTSGVSQILKDKNISYIVITPNVESGVKEAEETYYKVAKEQSKISFQALATMIASLSRTDQIKLWAAVDRNAAIQIYGQTAVDNIGAQSQDEVSQKALEIQKLITQSAEILDSDENADRESMLEALVQKLRENLPKELANYITSDLVSRIDLKQVKEALESGNIDKLKNIIKNNSLQDEPFLGKLSENLNLFSDILTRANQESKKADEPSVDERGNVNIKKSVISRIVSALRHPFGRAVDISQRWSGALQAGDSLSGSTTSYSVYDALANSGMLTQGKDYERYKNVFTDSLIEELVGTDRIGDRQLAAKVINETIRNTIAAEQLIKDAWGEVQDEGVNRREILILSESAIIKDHAVTKSLPQCGVTRERAGKTKTILMPLVSVNAGEGAKDGKVKVKNIAELIVHENTHAVDKREVKRDSSGVIAGLRRNILISEAEAFYNQSLIVKKLFGNKPDSFGYTYKDYERLSRMLSIITSSKIYSALEDLLPSRASKNIAFNYALRTDEDGFVQLRIYDNFNPKGYIDISDYEDGSLGLLPSGKTEEISLTPVISDSGEISTRKQNPNGKVIDYKVKLSDIVPKATSFLKASFGAAKNAALPSKKSVRGAIAVEITQRMAIATAARAAGRGFVSNNRINLNNENGQVRAKQELNLRLFTNKIRRNAVSIDEINNYMNGVERSVKNKNNLIGTHNGNMIKVKEALVLLNKIKNRNMGLKIDAGEFLMLSKVNRLEDKLNSDDRSIDEIIINGEIDPKLYNEKIKVLAVDADKVNAAYEQYKKGDASAFDNLADIDNKIIVVPAGKSDGDIKPAEMAVIIARQYSRIKYNAFSEVIDKEEIEKEVNIQEALAILGAYKELPKFERIYNARINNIGMREEIVRATSLGNSRPEPMITAPNTIEKQLNEMTSASARAAAINEVGKIIDPTQQLGTIASISQKFAASLVKKGVYVNKYAPASAVKTRDKAKEESVSARIRDIKAAARGVGINEKETIENSAKINKLLEDREIVKKAFDKLAAEGVEFKFRGNRVPPVLFIQASDENGKNVKLDFHGQKVGGTSRIVMIDAGVFNDVKNDAEAVDIVAELLSHEAKHVENSDNGINQVHTDQDDGNNLFLNEAGAFFNQAVHAIRIGKGHFGLDGIDLMKLAKGFEALGEKDVYDAVKRALGADRDEVLNYRGISSKNGIFYIDLYSVNAKGQRTQKNGAIVFDKTGNASVVSNAGKREIEISQRIKTEIKQCFSGDVSSIVGGNIKAVSGKRNGIVKLAQSMAVNTVKRAAASSTKRTVNNNSVKDVKDRTRGNGYDIFK